MKTTAHKFKKNPNCVYRHADLGGVVTIEHAHYPDKVFELTARERGVIVSDISEASNLAEQSPGKIILLRREGFADHGVVVNSGVLMVREINHLKKLVLGVEEK